jgi:hypothetical protein
MPSDCALIARFDTQLYFSRRNIGVHGSYPIQHGLSEKEEQVVYNVKTNKVELVYQNCPIRPPFAISGKRVV